MESKAIALKALIQASMFGLVVLLILFLLNAAQVLFVVFAGILLAVLFHGLAQWISKKTGMPEKLCLALAILVPIVVLATGMWLIAPAVSDQASQLAERMPDAAKDLKQQLLHYEWARRVWENKERLEQAMPSQSRGVSILANFFTSTLGALGNLVITLFVGLFLAIQPGLYINGVLRLIPLDRRARAHEVLVATGSALQSWLVAKLTAMAVIGILTALGLWLLGIDLALVLGLIAAILSFIPNFGPIASVIPALLIALVSGPQKALYVLLLYAGVQTFESYILTPMLQKHMVDMPPALLITAQVLLGVLVGILGVILATPLTAGAMVMIRMWYVQDLLGDRGMSGR